MLNEVTATEAARRFSELLNRVQYQGQSFTIIRNGTAVARLVSASERPPVRLGILLSELGPTRSGDTGFADDLEKIVADQPKIENDPWDS